MKNFSKEIIKILMRTACRLLILPIYSAFFLEKIFFNREKVFRGYSQLFSLIPGLLGEYLRREFYRMTLKSCSNNCCISFGTIFSTDDVEIGKGVYLGSYCIIGHVRIEENVLLASRVSILSGIHQHSIKEINISIKDQERNFEVIRIGKDCWIGEGAIIGANVEEHSVIAAGSVVFKAVPAFSIMKGNPAELVRSRLEPKL